jgi:NitT/TauT family transport system substrate-binding protein
LNNDIRGNLATPLEELRLYFSKAGEEFPSIDLLTRSGDTPAEERRRMRYRPPEILITPDPLLQILSEKGNPKGRNPYLSMFFLLDPSWGLAYALLMLKRIITMNALLASFALLGMLGSASGLAATPAPTGEPVILKLAVIPVIDTLPMFVAQAEGLYAKQGVNAKLIPVASAPERDQLLQAGQVDGTLNELLSVMFFNKEKVRMQAVRYGHLASPGAGHFFILASGRSGIRGVDALKGVEIGISRGTIIEYVTDRLLASKGLAAAEIKYLAVPRIPDRMALLASGELKAGVMPDPLAALAVQQGARIILDDTANPKPGASVISFRKEVIDRYPQAIKAFLAAIEKAVGMINRDPSKYGGLLAEKKIVPQPLISSYIIPKFPTRGVPTEAEWSDVLAWAKAKGLMTTNLAYHDSVNSTLLP